jgi:glycosyltransferase involved in cell wall biosynthesis
MTATHTQPLDAPADGRLETLSIVLPCFNEAPNLRAAVAEARSAAERFAMHHEIIIVDDGSADLTAVIAQEMRALDPRVRLVRHDVNRGYGAAVRTGIAASRGDWILLTDGDLQFDLTELEHFLPAAAGADLIAGYRIDRADPVRRRLAAHAWNRLMRASFGVGVRDIDCAFKLVRGSAARARPLTSDGAMISTELLVRASLSGWRVSEVGVHHRPRTAGLATGGNARVIVRAFRERHALQQHLRAERRPPARRSHTATA